MKQQQTQSRSEDEVRQPMLTSEDIRSLRPLARAVLQNLLKRDVRVLSSGLEAVTGIGNSYTEEVEDEEEEEEEEEEEKEEEEYEEEKE